MRRLSLYAVSVAAVALASCDDGSVTDPVYVDSSSSYKVELTASLTGLDQWGSDYSVVLAAYSYDSRYSVIQKSLNVFTADEPTQTVALSGIPVTANTIELAVTDRLRRRVATIYRYAIPEGQSDGEVIKIDAGSLDVSPFGVVDAVVFNGTNTNCVRCHGNGGAAGLDLSAGKAYEDLVGVSSTKQPGILRVSPGSAEDSFLYKVITQGDESVHYSHPTIFTEDDVAHLPELVKVWIELGAKQ